MGWNPKRALGFILAPFTGGMSLVASEASYQQEKAAKKAEEAQAAIIQAEEDSKLEAKKNAGRAILMRKQSARTGSLLGSPYSADTGSKTLLGQ